MADENKKQKMEKNKENLAETNVKNEKLKKETTPPNKKEKSEKVKSEFIPKKTEAIVNGRNIPISTKKAIAICNYIRGKNIDNAILMLEEVEKMKRAVPMKGEIPHRRGRIMSGRYPVKSVKEVTQLLKSLKSNAIANGLELEKYVIFCKADVASRPYRRFGTMRFKRTHILLKLIKPIKKKFRKVKKEYGKNKLQ